VAKIKPQYHVDISFLITGSERLEILRPAMDHTLEHLANGGLSVRVIDASPRESAEQNRRNFGAVPGINPQYWQKGGFMVDAYLELLGNSGKKYFFTLFDDEPILNFTLELLRGVCRQTYPSMPWGPDSGGKFEGCNFGI
jgi:hypothetical protein